MHSESAKLCTCLNCDYNCDYHIFIFICIPAVEINFISVRKLGREHQWSMGYWGLLWSLLSALLSPQLSCDQALLISSILQNACYAGFTNDYRKRLQWKPRRNVLQNAITTHRSSTTKTTQLTLALLIVGDHQRVNLLLGIWFKPDRCALVSFLYFMDSSNPLAFSQNRPSHVGK